MKLTDFAFLALLALGSSALAEVPKSIFDDDWKPATPEQVQPSAQVTPAPNPAPPATPTPPTPDTTTTPPPTPAPPAPAPAVTRLPVPSTTAQAGAWKLIKEDIYKDDIAKAKTPAQKVELAHKLLAVAGDTNKDMVGKYVLLAQAKELAIGSGDPPTAFKCLDELGKVYDINYPAMKLELFAALAKTVNGPADCRMVVDGLNRWADGQVKNDRYDTAKKACDIALDVARASRDGKSVNQTILHQKQIGEIDIAYTASRTALVALTRNPKDPGSNLMLGRFYCFIKNDWNRGLPLLALGNDEKLKSLAARELLNASAPDTQMAIGDAWWEIAERENVSNKESIQHHAGGFYARAKPGLEGLELAKVDKRLDKVKEADAERESGAGALRKWQLVFRSSDPTIWNTDSKDEMRFATPLASVPRDIQYLKMQIDPANYVIIAMTKEKLGTASDQGRFGWDGRNGVKWGGHQFGIFDRLDGGVKEGQPNGWVCIFYDDRGHSGWGFGYRSEGINDQGFAWDGKSIGPTLCEIFVTSGRLSPQEEGHLLKPGK